MTYIEFFDKTAIENVFACLGETVPDRVILLGDDSDLMKCHISHYERVFHGRGLEIEFIPRSIFRNKLDRAVESLQRIVDEYDDCEFDITGGDELLLMALGMICERNRGKHFGIRKCNPANNSTYLYLENGMKTVKGEERLSVVENVRLHGGDVIYGGLTDQATYEWGLTPEFRARVETLWEICRTTGRNWNRQIGVFAAVEEVGRTSPDGLTTVAVREEVEEYLRQYGAHYRVLPSVMEPLLQSGLLVSFEEENGTVTAVYKDPEIKRCLTVAGLVLELTVYLTALSLTDEEGAPMYDDAVNGVVIDWDGKRTEAGEGRRRDTENEIDVLLMHNTVPIFVSCKNGGVTAEELYKLEAVADRFGGKYAKKVLVATAIPEESEAGLYFRQRARDMGILLIEGMQDMDADGRALALRKLWDKRSV